MPQTISLPVVNATKLPDLKSVLNVPQKVLIVGQMTSAGSATSGALVQDVANGGAENALFGENSQIARGIRAYKLINQVTRIDAIPLDDDGGALAATADIVFANNADANGTFIVNINSRKKSSYTIAVTDLDTPTIIGDALVATITADTKSPVTASNALGTVTLTAVNKGTIGNAIGVEITGSVSNVTVTLAAAMTGGTTDPTLTNIFDVVGEERYQTVISPGQYGLDFVPDNLLDDRFNVDNNVLSGQSFCGLTDTLANLKTAGNAENSASLIPFGNKIINDALYKGSAMFEDDYVVAAQFAGAKAIRLTEGANINDLVANNVGALDRVGGIRLNSLPYFNTPFPDLPLVDIGKGFTQAEINELNSAGISMLGNNVAGTNVIAGNIVTAYKKDSLGNADITWKYLNYVNTGEAIAGYFYNNLKSDYAMSRVTDGDLVAGVAISNPKSVRGSMVKYYSELSDLVMTRKGETNLKFFKDNLSVTLDIDNGKYTVECRVPVVVQARQFDVPFRLTFNTQ